MSITPFTNSRRALAESRTQREAVLIQRFRAKLMRMGWISHPEERFEVFQKRETGDWVVRAPGQPNLVISEGLEQFLDAPEHTGRPASNSWNEPAPVWKWKPPTQSTSGLTQEKLNRAKEIFMRDPSFPPSYDPFSKMSDAEIQMLIDQLFGTGSSSQPSPGIPKEFIRAAGDVEKLAERKRLEQEKAILASLPPELRALHERVQKLDKEKPKWRTLQAATRWMEGDLLVLSNMSYPNKKVRQCWDVPTHMWRALTSYNPVGGQGLVAGEVFNADLPGSPGMQFVAFANPKAPTLRVILPGFMLKLHKSHA